MQLMKSIFRTLLLVGIIVSFVFVNIIIGISTSIERVEIREYEGVDLSSIDDFRENSIKGPQYVYSKNYRLAITGLVNNELEYTYDDLIRNNQHVQKLVTLHCVEGWSVTILWEGILIKNLIEEAVINSPAANTVIFYAYDGYSTSLSLDYIIDNNIMIAYKMNNITLPPERGYPFQLVAESNWGYKWIKWITTIEVSDNEAYRGFWESRGYPNDAEIIPEFPSWTILLLFTSVTLSAIIVRKKLRKSNMFQN